MAVKASSNITLFHVIDIDNVTIYYLLQSSTANPPAKPTTDNPGGNWTTTEPTYTEGSTNTLYTVTKTKFSDGNFEYTPVSKSSSYEAAKNAYNKALNAENIANAAEKKVYHTCGSSGGTSGYFYFARCVIVGNYCNKPISFTITNRGIDQTDVELRFANNSGIDPAVSILKKNGKANVYIVKADASTWDLYVQKTESYDNATFTRFNMNGYDNKFTWTWKDQTVASLPSGYITAVGTGEIVVGTQTTATGSWTGVANFDVLKDGQEITYWLPYAGSGNATLNLTLSGGNTTGAKNVYYSGTTRCTTHYGAGNIIRMVYRENVKIAGSGSYTGWWCDANYTDGNTYDRIRFNNAIKAKTAITASTLIVADDSGYYKLVSGTSFHLDKPILWAGSNIDAATTGTNNYLSMPSCTIRNNTNSSWTATQNKTLYLVGLLNGNQFTVDSTTPFTTTIPTEQDDKYYISLGYMYSTYQVYLYPEHPIFKYVNGEFKNISQIAYEAYYKTDVIDNQMKNTVTTGQLQSLEGRLINTMISNFGINHIRDSMGVFNDGSWKDVNGNDADVESVEFSKAVGLNGIKINNTLITQSIKIPNGIYTLSLKYEKNNNIEGSLVINYEGDIQTLTNSNVYVLTKEFNSPDGVNNINITLSGDADNLGIVFDLILNSGSEAKEWQQNQNETVTDTVTIGRGIKCESTVQETTSYMNAAGFIVKNNTSKKEVMKATSTGGWFNTLTSVSDSQINFLMFSYIDDEVWLNSIVNETSEGD